MVYHLLQAVKPPGEFFWGRAPGTGEGTWELEKKGFSPLLSTKEK
jgi:hypothetical protein